MPLWLIGLCKAECVYNEGPRRGVDDLELAALSSRSTGSIKRPAQPLRTPRAPEIDAEYYRQTASSSNR